MVERILEQEQAIRLVLSSDRKASHLVFTWQDLDVLGAINDALAPLAEFTDVMSGEKYITISAVLPIIDLLKTRVLRENEEDKSLTNEIRSLIISDLTSRNQDPVVVHLLETASFLDPRFKERYVSDIDHVKRTVVRDAIAMLTCTSERGTENSAPFTSTTEPPPSKKKRTLGSLFKSNDTDLADVPIRISPEQKVEHEMDMYLKEKKVDLEENPLEWWKFHEYMFPALSKVCKKYLCTPATSTSSERVFSKGGQIATPLRGSLKPDTVEMLIFLSMNL